MVEGAAAGKCERGNEGARGAVMLFAPRDLWSYLAERYDLAILPVRRRLVRAEPKRVIS
jgi:hypothetical protein